MIKVEVKLGDRRTTPVAVTLYGTVGEIEDLTGTMALSLMADAVKHIKEAERRLQGEYVDDIPF